MSSKEKKPKSKSKSKDASRKETDKSAKSSKSIKSDKSSKSIKSKSEKSSKKSVDKSKDKDKGKSTDKSPKSVAKSKSKSKSKEGRDITDEESKQQVNHNNTLDHNLTPVKDINPYDSINLSRPQFSPRANQLGLSMNNPNLSTHIANSNTNANADKCDGCFDAEAVVYCKECEKSFCSICENQLHLVPVNRTHERIPITEMNHLKKLCYHHNASLKFYCESCDEPICNECQILGPHNTKLHRIANIIDTYKRKYQAMNDIIQGQLMKKSEMLTSNLIVIDNKINELQAQEKIIEREIKKVYENMLDRLKSEEGKKTAMLNYESAVIQKELVQIGEILNYLKDSNDNGDILGFLLRFKQLNDNVESLITRQSTFEIDNDIVNLPNDIEIQKNQIDAYEKMKKLIKVKDDIIWNLLQGNNKDGGIGQSTTFVESSTLTSAYGKSNSKSTIQQNSAKSNTELAKSILAKVKKNSTNFYQLLCEHEDEIGSQMISRKGLLKAMSIIGININESDIDGLLAALNIKELSPKMSIKDLSLNLNHLSL